MLAHPSGANVLIVFGFVVIIVVAGAIWLRSNKSYQLTVGAMTRWACGHEATLSDPLDPGGTVAAASLLWSSGHRRPVRRATTWSQSARSPRNPWHLPRQRRISLERETMEMWRRTST
jgi:hypothetical protein